MSRFEDQLFEDLMQRHGHELAQVRPVRSLRPALATGVLAAVGAAAVGIGVSGVGEPAYAVTQHPDGTVTVTLKEIAAAGPTNAELARRGLPIRLRPITPDCPTTADYRVDSAAPEVDFGYDNVLDAITVPTREVPAGDLIVITVLADRAGRIDLMLIGGPPAKGEVASCLRGDEASMGISHAPPDGSSPTPDSSAPPSMSGSPTSSSSGWSSSR